MKICNKHGLIERHNCIERKLKTKMSYRCRLCKNEKGKEWKEKNREKVIKSHKEYNDKFGKRNNLSKYNITIHDYKSMLLGQMNVCAICHKQESTINTKYNKLHDLSVDHCHKTGKIRGLLCQKCNRGLGYFNDSVEIMRSAIQYIIKNG